MHVLPSKCVRCSTFVSAIVLVMSVACSTATSPTPNPNPPQPPGPTPDAPALSCPAPVTTTTTSPTGAAVTFTTPPASGGQSPVSVSCTPESGSTFPLGTTTVQCTATDGLNRTASCSFAVAVNRTPELTLTRFMAFGDSITAGEVTVPMSGMTALGLVQPLRVVPQASYPTVLRNLMTALYTAQAGNIVMVNDGVPGEKARDSATMSRFAQSVSANRPDVVLLMHGYNDVEDATVITDTVNAIDAMAAEARNRRVGRVFMINMAPGRPGGGSRLPSTIQAFNERFERAARGENAVHVDIHSALLPGVNQYIGIDGLHPTEAGYRKIAETVLAAIRANLERR
jgi:lysophospholipase L1-like esterase